jgi:tetratricopeptide (TPR) repeat protein
MTEFSFYSMNPNLLKTLNLTDLPFPVRTGKKDEIFGDKHLSLDLLLEELDFFLKEHPDLKQHYSDTMGLLLYILGIKTGSEGYHKAAAHYFEAGLWHNPANISLLTNYALALQNSGQIDQALSQYEKVINHPSVQPSLPLWLLAARLYAEKGNFTRAYQLLQDCTQLFPEDDVFWDFLAEMAEKLLSEMETESTAPDSPVSGIMSTTDLLCPRCEAEYIAGDFFCASCGFDLRTKVKRCPSCNFEILADDLFCPNCGKKL